MVQEVSRQIANLKILFLLAFGGGLTIAVYAMLQGVERNRKSGVTRPAPHLNLPALAGVLVAFGAVGYLLVRKSTLSSLPIALIALAAGAGAWVGMGVLMAKWALRPLAPSAHDEAEEVQGQLALVVGQIRANMAGSIRYERNGTSHEVPARGLDETELPPGADVVIDHFEDGVAIVEDWASVEARL